MQIRPPRLARWLIFPLRTPFSASSHRSASSNTAATLGVRHLDTFLAFSRCAEEYMEKALRRFRCGRTSRDQQPVRSASLGSPRFIQYNPLKGSRDMVHSNLKVTIWKHIMILLDAVHVVLATDRPFFKRSFTVSRQHGQNT